MTSSFTVFLSPIRIGIFAGPPEIPVIRLSCRTDALRIFMDVHREKRP